MAAGFRDILVLSGVWFAAVPPTNIIIARTELEGRVNTRTDLAGTYKVRDDLEGRYNVRTDLQGDI